MDHRSLGDSEAIVHLPDSAGIAQAARGDAVSPPESGAQALEAATSGKVQALVTPQLQGWIVFSRHPSTLQVREEGAVQKDAVQKHVEDLRSTLILPLVWFSTLCLSP